MFAEIARLPVGMFLWTTIGIAAGWLVALSMNRKGVMVLVLMGLGWVGAMAGGLAVGFLFRGDDAFMGSIFAAVVGGFVIPGVARVVQRRKVM